MDDKIKEYKSKHYPDSFNQARALMRECFSEYKPCKMIFYLYLMKEKDKILLVMNYVTFNVYESSLKDLMTLSDELNRDDAVFIGWLSKEYDLGYYDNIIKELYPDEKVVINTGIISSLSQELSELKKYFS